MRWRAPHGWRGSVGGRRATVLALLLALQALAAVFFVADVVTDLGVNGIDLHHALEAAVAAALIVGVVFGAIEMRRAVEDAERSKTALSVAKGAMVDLIAARLAAWGLTPAEKDVAYFALKGFDVAAIADLRRAAAGTVHAQLARVYAKAGVSGRADLLAIFLDDLIDGPLPKAVPHREHAVRGID